MISSHQKPGFRHQASLTSLSWPFAEIPAVCHQHRLSLSALETEQLKPDEREEVWMGTIKEELLSIPIEEDVFVEEILPTINRDKILLEEYGL